MESTCTYAGIVFKKLSYVKGNITVQYINIPVGWTEVTAPLLGATAFSSGKRSALAA